MVGQGVLRECLGDADVKEVIAVGRSAVGVRHEKLRQIVQVDLGDLSRCDNDLRKVDACFFCLGVSAFGRTEPEYRKITYDLTLGIATILLRLNSAMTFIYVSGAGTDSSERGRAMWARIKGATENALLRLPFARVAMFRPAIIQPLHGVTSKTGWYRLVYAVLAPIAPVLTRCFPSFVTTTEQVGRAMLQVAKHGALKSIFESRDINQL
jgi:uncharacterized protein YbjT (DUF2867 family)